MEPFIVTLPEKRSKGGILSFIEEDSIPFDVKRIYWVYGISEETNRGGHCHLNSDRLIICIDGTVNITIEDQKGKKFEYQLNDASKAVYYPKKHWMTMTCNPGAKILTLASCTFEEDQYLQEYDDFLSIPN